MDPLDPGLLYRRVDRPSGTSDGDGDDDGDAGLVQTGRARAAERKSARLAVGLYHAAQSARRLCACGSRISG